MHRGQGRYLPAEDVKRDVLPISQRQSRYVGPIMLLRLGSISLLVGCAVHSALTDNGLGIVEAIILLPMNLPSSRSLWTMTTKNS